MKLNTLNEVILDLVDKAPAKGIGYVRKNGEIEFISYRKTYENALHILGGLKAHKIDRQKYVLIILERNEEIIPTLWACIMGGIIPSVFQSIISFSNQEIPEKKIANVWELLDRPAFIVPDKTNIDEYNNNKTGIKLIRYGDLSQHKPAQDIDSTTEQDTAYIQFSSGSTANPKGIMLTHKNILANVSDIARANNINPETVPVNWMPLYHDMGLVGFHLTPLFAKCSQYLIDVIDFIKNPIVWLDTISKLGVDVTAGPNFGQALVLRHLARKSNPEWNFSTITNFFNGAEPISADIMSRFISKMGEYGFRETAMIPCYGMAEATLAITMRDKEMAPTIKIFDRKKLYVNKEAKETIHEKEGVKIVGVGQPLGHNQLKIVDDNCNELPEAKIGHICIKGENVTKKFYNPEISEDLVVNDGWLNTGDMGFFYQRELFITGRSKDLIIINGQNFYSHDLENTITGIKPETYGKIAICSLFDEILGRDKLLLFIVGSTNFEFAELYKELKLIFITNLGFPLDEIIPVRSSEIPRTSSGKLQRYKLVDNYQKGAFDKHLKF